MSKKSHPERRSQGGAESYAMYKGKRNDSRPEQKWNKTKKRWERK